MVEPKNENDRNEDVERADAEQQVSSELKQPRWSVISFDRREASNLTYAAAESKLRELESNKVPGLCIITDEAAAKMIERSKSGAD